MTRVLRALTRVCALGLAGACAATAWAAPLPVQELSPGVYVHRGQVADYAPENRGDLSNLGFVVGSRCVAVIDTGGSFAIGSALAESVRAVTPLPVCYVVNTHMHPDHVFGNAAFRKPGVEFVGHVHLSSALAQRAHTYVNALQRNLGEFAEGSEIVLPTRTVETTLELDLGERTLSLRAWRTSHTDNDVTVFDGRSGTLFAGDLLFEGHTPVVDGSLRGWIETCKALREDGAIRAVVPGHGAIPAPWPDSLDAQTHYLDVLLQGVRQAIKNGKTIGSAVDTVGQDERVHWQLFDLFHRRNVTASFAELEWED